MTDRCHLTNDEAPGRIDLGGREAPLMVRRSMRAKRMLLRVESATGVVVLTLPKRVSLATGLRFANDHKGWILARLAKVPAAMPFTDGATVPVRGVPHVVRHRADLRGTVWREGDEIHVAGLPEHLPRRLRDWLVREARADFTARTAILAQRLDLRIARISIRDGRSRWGSCSADGNIAFSWRIIMAPETVIDYLVAHEVAHLRHMNHGPAFWRLVAELCPRAAEAKAWLRRNGAALQRYGVA